MGIGKIRAQFHGSAYHKQRINALLKLGIQRLCQAYFMGKEGFLACVRAYYTLLGILCLHI